MSRKITFNTNRYYGPEGQIIEAEEFGTPYEDIDWMKLFEDDKEPDLQYLIFHDKTRNIDGKIPFCKLDEEHILRRYDAGEYDPA